jgi:DNA ligase-associated metallophosphoesterase
MQASIPHSIRNQLLWLSTERGMYWEAEKTLILSDLHFGKTGHFRKSGLAVPQAVYRQDLQRLVSLIQYFQPERLVIVGDLFHSEVNKEMDLFRKWRSDFPLLELHLVRGNHDILLDDWYRQASIELHEKQLVIRDFAFVHDIRDADGGAAAETPYFFAGHIHPGIRISGAGKQSLRLPCFYFGKQFAVLPAFSHFTGVALIDPKQDEQVFALIPPSSRRKEAASIVQIQ